MTKYIFITGGVVSSIGKGLASASLGALLQARGYKICLRKLDPYLNVDPGTMSPIQHGEVFVTEDGAETDLDLGHYERYTGINASKLDNVTTGKIYSTLLQRERQGYYLGATVQVIPHVTDLIKEFVFRDSENLDFVLCEIGGTVGDIEALPFLEAARQIGNELGRNNVAYVHVTLVPYIATAKELKTKPTQHSVKELRAIGIQPDVILCRSSKEVTENERSKIALFCNVPLKNVISGSDAKLIYEVPLIYHNVGLDDRILESLGIQNIPKPDLKNWEWIVDKYYKRDKEATIAIVCKYSLRDSYISLAEAINHAAIEQGVKVNVKWIDSRKSSSVEEKLDDIDAILVPGGFGVDGIEGKISFIKYAREHNIPFLGICLGMQLAVIEFARNVCGLKEASSSEFGKTPDPVIALLTEWVGEGNRLEKRSADGDLGGTMRLGKYGCKLDKDSKAYSIYKKEMISERHRHRYEFNAQYKDQLKKKGMNFVGTSSYNDLVEVVELPNHPWFIGVQFHPEFKSRPFEPHPLFSSFVKAAASYREKNERA